MTGDDLPGVTPHSQPPPNEICPRCREATDTPEEVAPPVRSLRADKAIFSSVRRERLAESGLLRRYAWFRKPPILCKRPDSCKCEGERAYQVSGPQLQVGFRRVTVIVHRV